METNWMTIDGWVDKEDVGYTYNGILAIKKEWNNAICSNMDGPRDYHTKWYVCYHLRVESNKHDKKELIYKTVTSSQILKSNLWLP